MLLAAASGMSSAFAGAAPSEWREWRGAHYRIEADGNLSCYSENGRNCKRGAHVVVDDTKAVPLVCGRAHRAVWPSTGYEKPGHWCNVAHANLFAVWHDYTLLGHRGELSKNARGDTMCRSTDGVTCQLRTASDKDMPAGSQPSSATSMTSGEIRPLVCGEALKRRLGISGYDDPAHWCNLPEIVARWVDPPPTEGGHRPVENGVASGWIFKDTLLPMPFLRVEEQPLWVAKVRSWAYHDQAAIDVSDGDHSLLSIKLPGMGVRKAPLGSDLDTVLHIGEEQPRTLRKLNHYGMRRHVFSFQVLADRSARFKRSSQMVIPLGSRASEGPWAPEHEEFSVNLPEGWGRSPTDDHKMVFRLYVDNAAYPGADREDLTEVEEFIVAKRRVRPAE